MLGKQIQLASSAHNGGRLGAAPWRPALHRAWATARRLLWPNARHSLGIWLVPLMLALGWYGGRDRYPDGVTLWPKTSAAIGFVAVLTSPLIAGSASWVAAQTERRRVRMVQTLPAGSQLAHHAAAWTGFVAWLVLAYAINAGRLGMDATVHATWGYLDPAPVLIGLAVMLAVAATGYGIGLLFPFAITAPAAAVVVFAWQFGLLAYDQESPVRYLSPFAFLNPEQPGVLATYWPAVTIPLLCWLLGVGLTIGGTIWAVHCRTWLSGCVALSGAFLCVTGAVSLLNLPSSFDAIPRRPWSFQPLCATGEPVVCVHPAYQAVLDQTAEIAQRVFAPVAGLPGIPNRIEQFPNPVTGAEATAVIYLPIYHASNGLDILARDYALAIIEARQTSDTYPGLSAAQAVIGRWLVKQAGFDPSAGGFLFMPRTGFDSYAAFQTLDAKIESAVQRFDQLPQAAQRAWFEAHLDALRRGELGMADLP